MSLLTHLRSKKKYWFIASVRLTEAYLKDGTSYPTSECVCWGFYTSKKKALKAVKNNWTDINEAGYYRYAVIEAWHEGLFNPSFDDMMWFEADYEEVDHFIDGEPKEIECVGYHPIMTPSFAENIFGYTMESAICPKKHINLSETKKN